MIPEIYLIVNPNCCQGKGLKKWKVIREEVLKQLPNSKELVTHNVNDLKIHLSKILQNYRGSYIISAGGDGSLHQLCNLLLQSGQARNHVIGAIGLGSSNDFLKPFKTFIEKVPVHIGMTKPHILQDVGKVRYTDENNIMRKKYFIVNASFGATAEGNRNFNNPGNILKLLKKINTKAAITYTAFTTILAYRNKSASIRFNGEEKTFQVSNINILKKPYVSGNLHYRQDILPDNGLLSLNICMNMKRRELIQTLLQLEKGLFISDEKRISTFITKFQLLSSAPVVFECDGETAETTSIEITVIPQAIKLLSA